MPFRPARHRRVQERTDRTCPACGDSAVWTTLGGTDYVWQRCGGCGTCYVNRLPTEDEIERMYRSYYGGETHRAPEHVERRLAEVVDSWGGYRDTERVLDIGFGSGDLLRAAAAAGWDCWGTEIAGDSIDAGAGAGWSVFAGDVRDIDLPLGGFDVVAMVEVLEHLPDPAPYVRRAAELLRPGGLLWATTPNGDSLNRRVLGASWSIAAPPEHLELYSRRGLELLLRGGGLGDVVLWTTGFNPSDLLARLRRQPVPTGDSRTEAAQSLDVRLQSGRGGRILRRAADAALRVTGLGDTIKARAVRPQTQP